MTRHFPQLLAMAAALAPIRLHAQAVADSGVFVVRHANDTIATESFSRTETGINGTLTVRNSKSTSQWYSAVLAPDGTVPLIEVTVRQKGDSGRAKARIVSRARVIFREDSAAVDEASDAGIRTFVLATRRGAIPYLNLSFALLEQAVRQARAHSSASEVPLFNLGGGQTLAGKVSALGADSVRMAIGAVEYHLRLDPAGRLLGGRIPAQDVVVERTGGS